MVNRDPWAEPVNYWQWLTLIYFCLGLLPEKEQTMKDVKNLLQTKVHEVYENNTHDFFIIKGQSGEEKDDQIVNANCKIVYFTQYMKQVGDSSIENTTI